MGLLLAGLAAGLKALPAGVAVRLFATPEEAKVVSEAGLRKLLETQLRHDLGWLEKDLKALRVHGPLANSDAFQEAFGLPDDAPMLRTREDRIEIW